MNTRSKNKISYENFIRQLSMNSELCRHLLGEDFSFATEYEAIAFTMNKMNRLATEENYIVHVMNNSLAKNGINISNEDIIFQLTDEFVAQEADFHLSAEVSNYELILELLYNLAQIQYIRFLQDEEKRAEAERLAELVEAERLAKRPAIAEQLFLDYKFKEALPLLEELEAEGNVRARYMLASISIGDSPRLQSILKILSEENTTYANELLQKNISVGDICSIFRERQCHFFKNSPLPNHLDALIKLADSGDVFAQYELGYYYDYNDNKLAFKYFKMAADQNHFFAQKKVAISYFWGSGVDKDYRKAIELYKKVHEKGYYAEEEIAGCYRKLDEYDKELEWLLIGNARDEYGFSTRLGYFYRTGKDKYKNYAKAIEYYKRSIELGASNGYSEYCIAEMYLDGGYGITASRSTAREWFKKAADKGNSDAQKWLREN